MTTEITKILEGFKHFSEKPYLDSINFLIFYNPSYARNFEEIHDRILKIRNL